MKPKKTFALALFILMTLSTLYDANGQGASSCERSFKILGVSWSQSIECREGYTAKCGIFKAKCVEEKQ